MFGLGIVKGLGITLRHFIDTFVDDLKYFPNAALNEDALAARQSVEGSGGVFTVEYPEMKLKTPENFRFLPFLVTRTWGSLKKNQNNKSDQCMAFTPHQTQ